MSIVKPKDSDHANINVFNLSAAESQNYSVNLLNFMSASNQCQFEMQRMETGITKALLNIGLKWF
ncbi:hypothetical protein PAXINDRAFT_7046 [Paxillus involutus ATCC 200175]|nr:hypothetical protein PAXINDRAFT_7046 [Paxillus involutus ATCC 200175]